MNQPSSSRCQFIYTNEIPDGTQSSLELLLIADQYNLKDLIQLCEMEISKTMTCQNAIEILNIANKVADAKRLREFANEFVVENILSIVTNDGWKQLLAQSNLLEVYQRIDAKKLLKRSYPFK